jgi:hypothetical protein
MRGAMMCLLGLVALTQVVCADKADEPETMVLAGGSHFSENDEANMKVWSRRAKGVEGGCMPPGGGCMAAGAARD